MLKYTLMLLVLAVCLSIGAASPKAMAQDPAAAEQQDGVAEAETEIGIQNPCLAWQYRAFDFWVGDWDVFDHEGRYAGRNLVSVEENGCLLVERWNSANGGTGQSYNFYNPATDTWRQLWVSTSVSIDFEGGYAADGGIALEGAITYRDGAQFPFRGKWTPNRNGTVTQVFEQYDPSAEAWSPWFVGIYRRVEDNPEASNGEGEDTNTE
ncbi:MAG: hypothetical protein AAGJ32_10720 [Pseudomonadota bacterium]